MRKLKIGNIELSSNVILAPMSGITDFPYREVVKKCGGAGLVVSEMIASRSMIKNTKIAIQKSQIDLHDQQMISSVQLAGCEADVIAEAAKMNEDIGAKIIDLNFGCPAKKVVNGYSGSALMKNEKLAQQILETTVKAVKIPVTVKMRLGWDENNKNILSLSKIAEDAGIQMITVHARTRSQFFSGTADWKYVAQVKNLVRIPVVINGDIKDCSTASTALNISNADGIMIGRGCYGKPWLLNQIYYFLHYNKLIDDPDLNAKLQIVLNHFDHILDYYGAELGVKIARKHLCWYSKGLSSKFRAAVNTMDSPKDIKTSIVNLFSCTADFS